MTFRESLYKDTGIPYNQVYFCPTVNVDNPDNRRYTLIGLYLRDTPYHPCDICCRYIAEKVALKDGTYQNNYCIVVQLKDYTNYLIEYNLCGKEILNLAEVTPFPTTKSNSDIAQDSSTITTRWHNIEV